MKEYQDRNSSREEIEELNAVTSDGYKKYTILRRIKMALAGFAIAFFVIACIGIPLGVHFYNNMQFDVSVQTCIDGIDMYTLKIKRGEKISRLKTRLNFIEGHYVEGVYKDEECTLLYDDNDSVDSNMTIYLKYKKYSFTVSIPSSEHYTIEICSDLVGGNRIEWGENFKFKIILDELYSDSDVVVICDERVIRPNHEGHYIIPNVQENKEVSIEGIQLNTYSLGAVPSQVVVKNSAGEDLSSYSNVPYGEVITFFYFESSSCYMTLFKVNGQQMKNGGTFVVDGNIEIEYAEQMVSYLEYSETQNGVVVTNISLQEGETEVVVPRTVNGKPVVSILDGAFSNNASVITSITIPSSVKTIGNLANTLVDLDTAEVYGSGFPNLTTIKIEEGVESIGDFAFTLSPQLVEAYLPNTISSVGLGAFGMCFSLEEFTLPNSMTSIPLGMFAMCTNLKTVHIPEGVTSIGDYAFLQCASLESITLPSSLEGDLGMVFFACSSLKNVTFGDGCKITKLSGTFTECASLESIVIPDLVEKIEGHAFERCSNLETIVLPKSLRVIELLTFYECISLREILIPKNVEFIMENAFGNCSSLEKITFEEGSRLYSWGHGIISGCASLKLIELPVLESGTWTLFNENYINDKNNCIMKDISSLSMQERIEFFSVYEYFLSRVAYYEGLMYRYFFGLDEELQIYIEGVEDENVASLALYGEIDGVFVNGVDSFAFEGCNNLSSLTFIAKDGYKWVVGSSDCSLLTQEQIVECALAGERFYHVKI